LSVGSAEADDDTAENGQPPADDGRRVCVCVESLLDCGTRGDSTKLLSGDDGGTAGMCPCGEGGDDSDKGKVTDESGTPRPGRLTELCWMGVGDDDEASDDWSETYDESEARVMSDEEEESDEARVEAASVCWGSLACRLASFAWPMKRASLVGSCAAKSLRLRPK
jgi:hypothetical protein